MAEKELQNAVKSTLESSGVYHKLKAEMRMHISNVLLKPNLENVKEQESETVQVVNEIIFDYLKWCGYNSSLAIFEEESGLKKETLARWRILEKVGVADTPESAKLPVLLGIIESFKAEMQKS